MPRVGGVAVWVMNHLIHHRGQLSVYLRLTGSKVPVHLRAERRRELT